MLRKTTLLPCIDLDTGEASMRPQRNAAENIAAG